VSVGVAIVTLNEEEMLPGCLDSVSWASERCVVDSGSEDHTVAKAQQAGARVLQRAWDGYASQKNYAMEQIEADWVLILDADERVSQSLGREIRDLTTRWKEGDPQGYMIPFRQHVLGRIVRHGGWGGDYFIFRLFRKGWTRYQDQSVHERLEVPGPVGRLQGAIDHYPYRSISQMIQKQYRYALLEAKQLFERGHRPVARRDYVLRPLRYWIDRYLRLGGFLDGTPGLILATMHAFCRLIVMIELNQLQAGDPSTPRSQDCTL